MEDKKSDTTVSEVKLVEEPMESDEMLSGSESAEITDSSDKAASGEEKSSEPSPMPSEPTSGVELTSHSATSASETPCESAEENPECSPMPVEHASSTGGEQSSETLDSGISHVVSEDNPELATALHEEKSKTEVESLAKMVSASAIGETEKLSEPTSDIEEKQKSETLASATPCEKSEALVDATDDTESKEISTIKSTPPKKSIFGNIKKLFSPPKSGKSKSRSKSMSPSEKAQQAAVGGTSNPEEADVVSEEEDHMKKGNEKSGVIKSIKRSLSKIMVRSKSSTAESANLVSDEETERNDEASKPPESKAEESSDKCTCNKPVWIDNRLSLTERPSWDGTTMTDIPSTTWSGGDVFPNDESRQPSEVGENTSEEAVAGSLASSPDEQIPDINEDAGSDADNMKKEVSNVDESKLNAVTDSGSEKQPNLEKEETKESEGGNQHE